MRQIRYRVVHLVYYVVMAVLAVACQGGGPHNIEIHRVDVQVDANQLAGLKNNVWNKELSVDCQVSWLNNNNPAKLSIHGASSRSYRKLSFSLKFAKDSAPKLNLFNYVGDKNEKIRNVILNAAWVDGTFMRNKLTWDLALEIGGVAPRTVWGEVYINGQYEGFYLIVEHVGDEMWKRLGWNDDDANVYKAVSHDGNFRPKGNALTGYDKKNNEQGSSDDLTNLLRVLDRTPKTFADFENAVQPVINIRDWFTYLFTCVYANNIDGYDKNYYLYHDQTTQSPFHVIPWDSDATWGNSWTGYPEAPGSNLWGADGMSQSIFSIPEYTYSYLTHFKCLIEQGAFRSSNILAKVDAWAVAIGPYVGRDEAKWFPVGRIDNRPFNLEVQDLRDYVNQRSTNFLRAVDQQLQRVASVGEDLVQDISKGQPYFTCGVSASQKKPKATEDSTLLPLPPPPSAETVLNTTICQGSSRTIACPQGTIIQAIAATWGRTDSITCVAPNIGNTNCRAEATERVNEICGRRSDCTLNGHNDFFTNPCPGIQKYLSLHYICAPSIAQATQEDAVSYVGEQQSNGDSRVAGVSAGSIALIVVGAVVLVVSLTIVIWVTTRSHKKQEEDELRP